MEIKIVDETYPFQSFITRGIDLVSIAPVEFYSNAINRLVHVTKIDKDTLQVNKRPAVLLTDIDKSILEQSNSMVDCGLEEFVYDLNIKKAIFDCKTSRTIAEFFSYPVSIQGENNLLLCGSNGKLSKIYQGTGSHSILWAMRIMKLFPFISDEYTKFGFALYCRTVAPLYGLLSPTFSTFYDSESELLPDEVMRVHKEISTVTPKLNEKLAEKFIEEIDDLFNTQLEIEIPLSLSTILQEGIPVTKELEDVEIDISLPMIKKIQIKDGILHLTPNRNYSVDSNALVEMFGEGYILVSE